jgi:hypothetical protein
MCMTGTTNFLPTKNYAWILGTFWSFHVD